MTCAVFEGIVSLRLPSGKHSQFAIEHGPVEIVDLPIENGGSFHSYVNIYQRVNPIKTH